MTTFVSSVKIVNVNSCLLRFNNSNETSKFTPCGWEWSTIFWNGL